MAGHRAIETDVQVTIDILDDSTRQNDSVGPNLVMPNSEARANKQLDRTVCHISRRPSHLTSLIQPPPNTRVNHHPRQSISQLL
jgi:hypothetical protein